MRGIKDKGRSVLKQKRRVEKKLLSLNRRFTPILCFYVVTINILKRAKSFCIPMEC